MCPVVLRDTLLIVTNLYTTTATNEHGSRATHRVVMEAHLGRPLTRDEIVHHINGDPRDNRLENLLLVDAVEHARFHPKHGKPVEGPVVHHSMRVPRDLLEDFRQAVREIHPENTSARLIRGFMRSVVEHAKQQRP